MSGTWLTCDLQGEKRLKEKVMNFRQLKDNFVKCVFTYGDECVVEFKKSEKNLLITNFSK